MDDDTTSLTAALIGLAGFRLLAAAEAGGEVELLVEQLSRVGADTLVNPVNCAMGRADASIDEKRVNDTASPRSSLEFLLLLGRVFDVQDRAYEVARELSARIVAVNAAVVGQPAPKVLVVYPGMSMMNDNGLPAVLAGGIYDAVLEAAGVVNAFPDADADFTRTINAEQAAAALPHAPHELSSASRSVRE